MKHVFILIAAMCLISAGCGRHEEAVSGVSIHATNDIPAKFAFITTNTTLQQVIDKIGKYDRVRGSGISYYEYDLPDGSAVLISPEWPFKPANKIRGVTFYRSTNEIGLYP